MSSNGWRTYKLGDIVDIKHGYAFKGEFFSDKPTNDILLTPGNFRIGGGFKSDKFKYYDGDYPKEYILKTDDVIVTMTDLSKTGDTLGYSALVPESGSKKFLHNQRLGLLQFKRDNFDKRFIYWLLRTKPYQTFVVNSATGSTVKHTSLSRIREYEFEAPDLPAQRRIADILSALDEKIELNRQTNATLQAIAQAIFKEWFVDFNLPVWNYDLNDPMKTMIAGGENHSLSDNQKNHSADELGMIPQGWRVGKLGEVCELAYGKGLKSENRIEGEYPVVGSNGIVGNHSEYLVEGPGIVIGRKGTIGEVIWLHQNFFPIDTTFYIKDLLGVKALYFHYFLLKEQDFKKIGSDSAVPGLNRNQAYDNLVVIPSTEAIEQFNEKMVAIFEKIYNNEEQSATLASLRDALLPKLMSGEIEV